jgi:hypothetical protein
VFRECFHHNSTHLPFALTDRDLERATKISSMFNSQGGWVRFRYNSVAG